jgi:hypothetical protein
VTSAEDTVYGCVGHGHDVMSMMESGVEISSLKPLSELTIGEVGRLLESIEFDEYKVVFAKNKIDGKCLTKCNTVKNVQEMGIPMTVKASLLLDEIRKWKAASQDDDRNSEVKSPIVSYVPLTILHMLFYYIVLHTYRYMCLYIDRMKYCQLEILQKSC